MVFNTSAKAFNTLLSKTEGDDDNYNISVARRGDCSANEQRAVLMRNGCVRRDI